MMLLDRETNKFCNLIEPSMVNFMFNLMFLTIGGDFQVYYLCLSIR